MARPRFNNWGEYLLWVYSSLNMLMAALKMGISHYDRRCFALRSSRFKAYKEGRAHVASLYKNNLWKMSAPQDECWYCGSPISECGPLSADHILPRSKGGGDEFDNIAFCCRSCNSSKGIKDLVAWSIDSLDSLPSLFMLCIYLKLVYSYSERLNLFPLHRSDLLSMNLPFSVSSIDIRKRSVS
ncbi:MAG: HNH endonuclease [Bacteroidales bacterium]|nr:HNH endonuclease [Bacteroidales bacterium]